MQKIIQLFLTSDSFIPHGHCYLWKPSLVWLHILSDSAIALAYYSIPLMLIYFVRKRQDIPFKWIFWMFGAFIIACGTTHLMEVWTLWHPTYWLSGGLKVVTAIVSLYTALALFPLIPQLLALPSPTDLEAANAQLKAEVLERQQVLKALQEREALFRSIFEGAALGIELVNMAGRTVAMNAALHRMLGYEENETSEFIEFENNLDGETPCIENKHHSDRPEKRYLDNNGQLDWNADSYHVEKCFLSKNGQRVWGHVTGSVVRDREGEPQYVIRMVEDITARKQALKQLQEYQEHLEELVKERTAELSQVNERLLWQASHDSLTGLINRHEFEKRLIEAVSMAKRYEHIYTLCYLDLDRFKIVNDTCGHVAGDELLRQVSTLLKTQVRQTDIVARLGGDEFAVLLYHCPIEQALPVARKLQESIQKFRFVWEEKPFTIGVSIGMVTVNSNSLSLDRVLNEADTACYAAKHKGRNRIEIYQADDRNLDLSPERTQWVKQINQALEQPISPNNPLRLYYQPIVSLKGQLPDGSLVANSRHSEILLRWVTEDGEIIPPMAFFPTAERSNLMEDLDRWVIRSLFSLLRQQGKSLNNQLYSINLSAATLSDRQFISFLQEQLTTYEIPPDSICFELTETTAIANLSKVVELIQEIKALGCRLALDDFGSGMSSLAYLKHLPVDYLKIDGVLIKEVATDPIATVMVESINRLAHLIGIETIAEFVSDALTLQQIKAIGLNYAQGYSLAEPQPLPLPLVVSSQRT